LRGGWGAKTLQGMPLSTDILLPARSSRGNLGALISALAKADGSDAPLRVSMAQMLFYEPVAICMLLARLRHWSADQGRSVEILLPPPGNPVVGYMAHMGFFEQVGVVAHGILPAKVPKETYCPIALVDGSTSVGQVTLGLTKAASAKREVNDELAHLLGYAISELLLNARQHSRGEGFVMAQYYQTGLFQIAVADNGIGIRRSYLDCNSPIVRGRESLDDAGWVEEAIVPESSSKVHLRSPFGEGPVNRGVGLTLCRSFAKECLGDFLLISHSGSLHHGFEKQGAPREPRAGLLGRPYLGVACGVSINPAAFGACNYTDFRRGVLRDLGLADSTTPLTGSDTLFESP